MTLLETFVPGPRAVVSLAGGGGKTTLMWMLAAALVAAGKRTITTTTTRIYPPAGDESPRVRLLADETDPVGAVAAALEESPHVTIALEPAGDKLRGLPSDTIDTIAAAGLADAIIVEADGAAGRPLKAARAGEPVWPARTSLCVALAGIDGLGRALAEGTVFRAELAAEITGLPAGSPVTADAVAALLVGERGMLREAPAGARLLAFVNKVETDAEWRAAQDLAGVVLARARRPLAGVVLGSLRCPARGFTVRER